MHFVNVFLFFCIVTTHVCFTVPRPRDPRSLQKSLKEIELSLCDLLKAERDYVKLTYEEGPPEEYMSHSLRPLDGVTLPVGNDTEEIQATVCAITDYLDNHLLAIIGNLTGPSQDLISDISVFREQFKTAVRASATPQRVSDCHRPVTGAGDTYELRETGLRIIYFTRLWVESFTNTTLDCDW